MGNKQQSRLEKCRRANIIEIKLKKFVEMHKYEERERKTINTKRTIFHIRINSVRKDRATKYVEKKNGMHNDCFHFRSITLTLWPKYLDFD